jgi:hypothetical protein
MRRTALAVPEPERNRHARCNIRLRTSCGLLPSFLGVFLLGVLQRNRLLVGAGVPGRLRVQLLTNPKTH